jgi:hypothetical protein
VGSVGWRRLRITILPIAAKIARAKTATPMPMPAFAPVLKDDCEDCDCELLVPELVEFEVAGAGVVGEVVRSEADWEEAELVELVVFDIPATASSLTPAPSSQHLESQHQLPSTH